MRKQAIPVQFFTIAFIWSWTAWLPLVLAGFGIIPMSEENIKKLAPVATMIAAFGPGIAAFYCLRKQFGSGAVKTYLKNLFDFHFGWKAIVVPVILLISIAFIVWIFPMFFNKPSLPSSLPSLWAFPLVIIIMTFVGGGQEELGWRGYILDILEARLGVWNGNIILAMIWTVWHLPLFFIPGVAQYYIPFGGFALVVFGYTGILAWVRSASGKNLMAGLLVHGVANAVPALFPTFVLSKDASQSNAWIWSILTFFVGFYMLYLKSKTTSYKD